MTIPFHGFHRPSVLAGLILMGMAATSPLAAGAPVSWPPLGDVAHAEHHPGKMIWADLVTPDLAVAERFYGGLFGWEFHAIHPAAKDFVLASQGGHPLGCLIQRTLPQGESRQSAWLAFFAVRDVDAAGRMALKAGAKPLAKPKTVEGHGRQAVFYDPQGAVFGMFTSSSGDPSDELAGPGEWLWSSLLAQDPAQDAAFYQTVFGYDVFPLPPEGEAQHLILSTDDFARASVNSMPGGQERRHPHWLNFIRVTDSGASAARAVALGGRILVQPHVDRHGGRTAVIADPAGAPLGLMEWTDKDTLVEPK
jgi:predicted enzyme related to lactoylglutathione lyase